MSSPSPISKKTRTDAQNWKSSEHQEQRQEPASLQIVKKGYFMQAQETQWHQIFPTAILNKDN